MSIFNLMTDLLPLLRKKLYLFILSASFLLVFEGCKKDKIAPEDYYHPKPGDRFEWRLDSITIAEANQYHTDIIDIDAFSATKELVEAFHAKGIKVIAYVSVGTLESYRDDAYLLPPEVIGNVYPDWPDERFLDLRQIDKLKPFILSRLDMIKEKGFDGVEPDNIDGYQEDNGFELTIEDSKKFCEWLINEAHERELSIGQKNTEELVPSMHQKFDWALTEDVFYQNIQDCYQPYITAGKPVFSAEYTDVMNVADFRNEACPKATLLHYFLFLKHRDLNKWTYDCN